MKHLILIPTYNEADTIERIVSEIFRLHPEIYVKVIDDNSPDGTGKVVRALMKKFPNLSILERKGKEGLGKAYMGGFREALASPDMTHLIMMDADMSHDPKYLHDMVRESIRYDLVIGSRYIPNGRTVGWEAWRRALSFFGNLYARTILLTRVHDLTGGFNCISLQKLREVDLDAFDSSGYAFQIELKHALLSHRASVKEIPIVFANRTGGESKISNHIVSEGLIAPWKMVLAKNKKGRHAVCPLCGKTSYFYTRKNSHNIYKCSSKSCYFMFVYPVPDAKKVYSSDYFSGAKKGFGYVDYDTDKAPMTPTFEKYLDYIKSLGIKSGQLLDVGCATGFFMGLAQKKGFKVSGVEISDYAAEKGRAKGLHIITGEWADFPDKHFDVVTMLDVLEHMPDPQKILTDSHRILRKGGLLVINTPNAGSLLARLLGRHWHLIVPPEHLSYFSAKNLSDYLLANGFVVEKNTSLGKRFTFQYIFKTLYVWQKFLLWRWLENIFSKCFLKKLYIPLNTHDNMLIIARKK